MGFANALRTALYAMFATADRAGVTRVQVAKELGLSPCTIDSWKNPSCAKIIPTVTLVTLLRRDGVVPQLAKVEFINHLMDVAGIRAEVFDGDQEDMDSPAIQALKLCANIGAVSERIARAGSRDSDGGERMTATEIKNVSDAIAKASDQLAQLRRTLHSQE